MAAPLYLDAHVIVLARQDGKRWAVTATNNATVARTLALQLPSTLAGVELVDALTGQKLRVNLNGELRLTLPALFGSMLLWN